MSRIPGTTGQRPRRALFVLSSIPDDAPEEFKNGLAIRNAATLADVCPDCGAVARRTGPDADGFLHLTFRHETWCGVLLDGAAA